MSFSDFKNFLTFNLISLCGYVCVAISMFFIFITHPKAIYLDKLSGSANIYNHSYDDAIIPYLINTATLYVIVAILVVLLAFEIYLYKKHHIQFLNFSNNANKLKEIFLWLGIILLPFPFYILIIAFIGFALTLPR